MRLTGRDRKERLCSGDRSFVRLWFAHSIPLPIREAAGALELHI